MKTKLKKFSLGSLLGIFAIAIVAAVAWSVVASNAFAATDEATTPDGTTSEVAEATTDNDANVVRKISFNIQGLEDGDEATYVLTNEKKEEVAYTLGSKLDLEVDSTSSVHYKKSQKSPRIEAGNTSSGYVFLVQVPFGYNFKSFSPEKEPKLDNDVDFSIILEKVQGKYDLEINVRDNLGQSIDGFAISFYDKSLQIVGKAVSADGGKCYFKDLDASQALGTLVGDGAKVKYADSLTVVRQENYNGLHGTVNINVDSAANATLMLNAEDENHDYFYFAAKALQGETVIADVAGIKEDFHLAYPVEGLWKADHEGNLTYHTTISSPVAEYEYYMNISGVAKEGFRIDHWLVDTASNASQEVYPDQEFTIPAGAKLNAQPVYVKDVPGPGPEPVPTPTPSEEVNATAQTGDSTVALPLAILAIAAGSVVFIARRKFN